MSWTACIAEAVRTDVALTDAEREAILAIAVLTIAADHVVHEREIVALRRIALELGGAKGAGHAEASIDNLIARGIKSRDDADARLRELASSLTTPGSHAVAYKVAYALSLSDRDAADQEFELDLQLIDALGLTQPDADTYAADVTRALGA